MSGTFTESVVEQAALAWLESVRWQVRNGAEIAPDEAAVQRDNYGQVVLTQPLRESLMPLVSGDVRLEDAEKPVGRAA